MLNNPTLNTARQVADIHTPSSSGLVGFIGQTERGPLTPQIIHSWDEYTDVYGSYHDKISPYYLPLTIKGFYENGGGSAIVVRVAGADAKKAELNLWNTFRVEALGPGTWGNRIFIHVQEQYFTKQRSLTDSRYSLTVLYFQSPPEYPLVWSSARHTGEPCTIHQSDKTEFYENIVLNPDDKNFFCTLVNGSSKLIRVHQCSHGTQTIIPMESFTALHHGEDATSLTPAFFTGVPPSPNGNPVGLASLDSRDDVSLICIPEHVQEDASQQFQSKVTQELIQFCERKRTCLALLSIEKNKHDVEDIFPPSESRFGVIYYPWIRVTGYPKSRSLLIPPLGHVAGVMVRSNGEQGIHRAPSNTVIRGIYEKESSPLEFVTTKQHQLLLNERGVNVIRDFRSVEGGIRVWGLRTMSPDSRWCYIHVQRFAMFLEKNFRKCVQATGYTSLNINIVWKVIEALSFFLETQWRNGVLLGSRREEAFFVKCDPKVSEISQYDNPTITIEVGVALHRQVEFTVFRFDRDLKLLAL